MFLILNKIDLVRKSETAADRRLPDRGRLSRKLCRVSRRHGRERRSSREGDRRAPAGREASLSRRFPDRPARAFFAAEIVREKSSSSPTRKSRFRARVVIDRFEEVAGDEAAPASYLHDRGRARVAEADRRRQGRRHDQEDRHRRPRRARTLLYLARVPGPSRPRQVRVARRRQGCSPSSAWTKIVERRASQPSHARYATEALILRTYKLGESDRIVVFLTRDRGKKRGVAKNARQSRRRFGGGLEPMTIGRVVYVERSAAISCSELRRAGEIAALPPSAATPRHAWDISPSCSTSAPRKQTRTKGCSDSAYRRLTPLRGGVPGRTARQVISVLAAAAAGGLSTRTRRRRAAREAFLETARTCEAAGSRRNARGPRTLHELETAHRIQLAMSPGRRSLRSTRSAERAGKIGKCRLSIW